MARNFLMVLVCFVALEHKHVLGDVILRDITDIQNIILQPMAEVLCPWKEISEEDQDYNKDLEIENRAHWCGTKEEVGGVCNAKCSDSIIDGYIACANEFKSNIEKFIERLLKFFCKKAENYI